MLARPDSAGSSPATPPPPVLPPDVELKPGRVLRAGEDETAPGKVNSPVSLTEAAVRAAKSALARRSTPGGAVRLGVRGGGCSGFSYVIEFDDDPPRSRDRVFDFDGVTVYVDKKSLLYLNGSVLDFEKTLMRQGFKFRNPNVASTCSCGTSFTVK